MSPRRRTQVIAVAAAIAALFGVATVVAGSRVLLGADPGYVVFKPLLLFNTAMGFAYIVVAVLAWRRSRLAVPGAGLVALLNLAVLAGVALLHSRGEPVAIESVRAMVLRASVWGVLFIVLLRANRASPDGRGGA